MNKIKIIVNGANGKMGSETVQAIEEDTQCELVAALGHADDLAKKIQTTQADCVVDFTTPDAVFENTKTIIENNVHPIIGTTGLSPEQIQTLQELAAAKKLGGVIAPNFSISMVLMMQLAKKAAEFLPDVEIIELHHPQKKDAPSGTAIKTAELLSEVIDTNKKTAIDCHELLPGALGAKKQDIPIHSVRLPGLVAHQQIIFGGHFETLSFRHDSLHRKSFMPGVLLACKRVNELDHLAYGLEVFL